MRPSRVVAIVAGTFLVLPALAMLLGGSALLAAYAFARDDGYFESSITTIDSSTAAVTAEDITYEVDPDAPGWALDVIEADVRLRVTSAGEGPVFVGIAREADADEFLAGVAHDEVTGVDDGDVVLARRAGSADARPPTDLDLWVASATGTGTQQLDWEATDGRWAVVLMNADGSEGVRADVDVGVRLPGALPVAVVLVGLGAVLTALAVVLIVFGASGSRHEETALALEGPTAEPSRPGAPAPHPVTLEARLDPDLSRWRWLVKWLLAIPHLIVLAFLWIAFVVLTVVAGFAILFTGRYPRRLFDFNVGVLRWTWRVMYYATTGGLGTDAYPPFSLDDDPSYPARLTIAHPVRLSRGLVLVKWWLLAIPHYLVVGVLLGGAWVGTDADGSGGGIGLLSILVAVAAVVLLFSARYPQPLFDLIVGLNRWIARVVAYAALMTDDYPPFRLDQGGDEPPPPEPDTPPGGPATTIDLRETERPPAAASR